MMISNDLLGSVIIKITDILLATHLKYFWHQPKSLNYFKSYCMKNIEQGASSGPYFPVFELNTKIYSVQFEYEKIQVRKNSEYSSEKTDTSQVVSVVFL